MKINKTLLIIIVSILIAEVPSSSVLGCYTVTVGKDASADGSVIFGHNEQNGGSRIINLRVIPRIKHNSSEVVKLLRGGTLPEIPETYSFIWSENPGLEFSDTYINEWGVAVASNGCPT
jgi:dipeptidase